ncbi:DUF6040 family protein [Agathobacter rectalis]|nr:DUF6040 family protein [Agathobacter rectalis]
MIVGCGDLTILLLGLGFHCFLFRKRKTASQPWQAIAQRFCSIPVDISHILGNLITVIFLTTTLFQAVQSDVFLSDCKSFFHDAASFIQTFIGWTIDAGQSVAQISTKIPNEIIAGIIYWLLMILVVGICVAGTGILAILIEIKVIELYKKNCWDVITLLMILTSAAVIIYFGEVIKKALSINLLFFWLILQGIYLTIRRYISQDTD